MYANLSESAILLSQYQVPASSVPYPMENSQKQQQISYWDERSNPSYNRLHNQTDNRTHYENFHKRFSCYFCLSIQFVCKNVIPTLTHNVRNKRKALYHSEFTSTIYPVRGITGCPLTVEFIQVTAFSLPFA